MECSMDIVWMAAIAALWFLAAGMAVGLDRLDGTAPSHGGRS
jgi:hypothetical protein